MQAKLSRLGRVMRFCIAGSAGVVTYYAALYCLTEFLGIWYIASALTGFILNTGLNFTLQKFWTFQNKETGSIRRQVFLYLAMTLSFLMANTVLLYLMVEYLHMWYMSAQMILTMIISVLSFVISGRIFRVEGSTIQESRQ